LESLEGFERNLANFYEVKVRIDVLFEGKCESSTIRVQQFHQDLEKLLCGMVEKKSSYFQTGILEERDWIDYLSSKIKKKNWLHLFQY
jgi:hypothetical protein